MGYRSEVAYAIQFKNNEQPEVAHKNFLLFQDEMKRHTTPVIEMQTFSSGIKPIETDELYGYENVTKEYSGSGTYNATFDFNSFFCVYPSDGLIVFYNSWTKWYPDFHEVQWHMTLLDKVADFGGDAKFIRLGEDYDDIEVNHYGKNNAPLWDWIDVEQRIKVSLPDEPQNTVIGGR